MNIEDADEESEVEYEPPVTHSKDRNLGVIPKCSTREKGKGLLIDDGSA